MSIEVLGAVQRLDDGRYFVINRGGAGMCLELHEWQEALDEMKRIELFYRITTGRQRTTTEFTGNP